MQSCRNNVGIVGFFFLLLSVCVGAPVTIVGVSMEVCGALVESNKKVVINLSRGSPTVTGRPGRRPAHLPFTCGYSRAALPALSPGPSSWLGRLPATLPGSIPGPCKSVLRRP